MESRSNPEEVLLAPKEVQGAVANLSWTLPGIARSKVVFSDLVLDDAQLRRLDGREERKEEEKEESLSLSGLSFLARLNALEAREGQKKGREAEFSLSSNGHLCLTGEATASDGRTISLSFDYETVLAGIVQTGEISARDLYCLSILYDGLTGEHFILSLKPGREESHLHLLESVFSDLHSVFSLADEKTQATIAANRKRINERAIKAYGGVTGEEYEQVKRDLVAVQAGAQIIVDDDDVLRGKLEEARIEARDAGQKAEAQYEDGERVKRVKGIVDQIALGRPLNEILSEGGDFVPTVVEMQLLKVYEIILYRVNKFSVDIRTLSEASTLADVEAAEGVDPKIKQAFREVFERAKLGFVGTDDEAEAIQEGRREETKDGSQQVLGIIQNLLAGKIKIPEGKTLIQVLSAEIKGQLPEQVLHILEPIGLVICHMRDTIDRTGEAIRASNPALAPAAIQKALADLIEESEERGRLEMKTVVKDREGKIQLALEDVKRKSDKIRTLEEQLAARPTREDLKRLETERDQLQVQLGQRAEVTPAQLVQLQRELATLKASGRPEDRARIVKMEAELAETQRKLKEGVGTSEQVGKIAAILGVKPGEVLAAVEEIVGEKLKKEKELRRLLGEITSYKSGLKTDTLYRMFLPFLTPGNGISTKDLEGNFPPDKPELIKKVKSRTLRISDNDLKRGELESGLREEINYFLNAIKTCLNARFEGDPDARMVIPQLLLPSGVSQEGKLPYLKTLLDLGLYLLE